MLDAAPEGENDAVGQGRKLTFTREKSSKEWKTFLKLK